jgi:PAS domain S-box-containing protein
MRPGSGMKVLYLEDNPNDAALTLRTLRKAVPVIDVEVVATVAEAMERLDKVQAAIAASAPSPYDLVLLDMHLPDGSGLNVAASIRHRALPLAIVVLTGSGDEESVLAAIRSGADDYAAKRPEYWNGLDGILCAALEGFRSQTIMRGRRIRLLCAEPNPADIHLMRRLLATQAPHVDVETVATGKEILDRLPLTGHVSNTDVLLLDYRLPDTNALDLLREIRQVRRLDLPVIVNTGMGSEEVVLQALKLGAADYLTKAPGYLDRLLLVVERAYYRASTERERTALIESELRMRTIIETEPEGVMLLDSAGRILQSNPAGLSMFQAESLDRLRLKPLESFVPPGFLESFRGLFREVMSGKAGIIESRVKGLKGAERWVDIHAAPMAGANAKETLFLGIIRDITERKENEERLRHTQKMNAFGQLAGGVAHDFNNQLAAILGYSEMLSARIDDPEMKRYAESIEKAARRSSELTRNLLTFARQAPSQSIPVDIHSLVGETVDLLERTIDKRIVVSSRLEARPSIILGDPSLVQNALLNLALNARDAMPEGGSLVIATETIRIGPGSNGATPYALPPSIHGIQLPDGHYLHLTVSDTGTGMTDEIQQRIFEPFFTTKPVGKGTGMGLASVFGTVKLHLGAITLMSAPGQGTVFHLYFPISKEALHPDDEIGTEKPKLRSLGILVVDDEAILRELLVDLLNQEGHTVYSASTGVEAIKIYESQGKKIDLVILDMIMPELGGRETFRALRRMNPVLKVLLSSGYSPNEEIQDIMDEGILGILHKPYSKSNLEEAIFRAVSKNAKPA